MRKDLIVELDNLLMDLGFCMGYVRYENVRKAIMLTYAGETNGMTKCLYPAVAASNGGNAAQVEKSIRDAIRCAFQRGDRNYWMLYFPCTKQNQCPSNKVFITRIAYALQIQECLTKNPPAPICLPENEQQNTETR